MERQVLAVLVVRTVIRVKDIHFIVTVIQVELIVNILIVVIIHRDFIFMLQLVILYISVE